MKRFLRVGVQWVVVLAAGYLLYQLFIIHDTEPVRDPASWSQWEGFQAIAYGGISRTDSVQAVSREQLREQLQALRDAGYRTVHTHDLVSFLRGERPLPEKALYIMFEGGRKDSFLFSQPILSELGMHASMYVRPGDWDWWSRTFLRAHEVRRVAENAHWDVNSLGYATADAGQDSQGGPRLLLEGPAWLPDEARYESFADYEQRLREDFQQAYEAIKDVTDSPPTAYSAYPANTVGVALPDEVDRLTRALIQADHGLAFTLEGSSFNSRFASPYALTRLTVPAHWSAQELLDALEHAWPRADPYTAETDPEAEAWRPRLGLVTVREGDVVVTAVPAQPQPDQDAGEGPTQAEALAWLRGAEGWRDLELEFNRPPLAGGAKAHLVYLKYRAEESWLRVAFSNDRVVAQEQRGPRLETLFNGAWNGAIPRSVQLTVKGDRLTLEADGEPIARHPVPASSFGPRGGVALGLLAETAPAVVSFEDFTAAPLPERWLLAEDPGLLTPPLLRDVTHVALPAALLTEEDFGPDERSIFLRAAASGVRLYLQVTQEDLVRAGLDTQLNRVAERLGSVRALEGVALQLRGESYDSLTNSALELVRSRGLATALIAPPAFLEALGSAESAPALDWMLIDAPRNEAPPPSIVDRIYPPSMVLYILPESETRLGALTWAPAK